MKILVFGGTGIVGETLTDLALKWGCEVTAVGAETTYRNTGANYVHVNDLHKLNRKWDAIADIFTFDKQEELSEFQTDQILILSSTLVYDRSKYSAERIPSNHPKAKKNTQGGYVDHKLELEDFWSKSGKNWTFLRPYHIIGPGSYLGCLPPHNRNPLLLAYIQTGELRLCDGGRVPINIVNPRDISETIVRCIGNSNTFGKCYNLVNPKEIIARDYYLKIAEIVGKNLKIKNIPGEEIWAKGDWKLTTFPHLYDISDLEQDIEYVPSIGLEESLREAIKYHPTFMEKNNTEVHKRMHMNPQPLINIYYS